jgi:hypothetical protein
MSQITTGLALKLGSSFKGFARPEAAVLGICETLENPGSYFVKKSNLPRILISVHTSDTREGGNEIMSASWASHLATRNLWMC